MHHFKSVFPPPKTSSNSIKTYVVSLFLNSLEKFYIFRRKQPPKDGLFIWFKMEYFENVRKVSQQSVIIVNSHAYFQENILD